MTNPVRAPPTLFLSPGVYNYSADPQGIYFLRAAASYHVPQLTAFVNAAPTAFVSNGKSCGGTILADKVDAFGGYVADIVAHFRGDGIPINLVSPMNEPNSGFADCRQEGMLVRTLKPMSERVADVL